MPDRMTQSLQIDHGQDTEAILADKRESNSAFWEQNQIWDLCYKCNLHHCSEQDIFVGLDSPFSTPEERICFKCLSVNFTIPVIPAENFQQIPQCCVWSMVDLFYGKILTSVRYTESILCFFFPDPKGFTTSKASWYRIKPREASDLKKKLSFTLVPSQTSWNMSLDGSRECTWLYCSLTD